MFFTYLVAMAYLKEIAPEGQFKSIIKNGKKVRCAVKGCHAWYLVRRVRRFVDGS